MGIGALCARCRDRGVLWQRCRRCWEQQAWLWECSRGPARHGEGMGFSRRSWEPQGRCGVVRCSRDVWGLWVLQRFYRAVFDPAPPVQPPGGPQPRARRLAALPNRSLRVRMSDGRTLVGAFLCTDRDANIILGSAQEFLKAAGRGPWWEMGPQGQWGLGG